MLKQNSPRVRRGSYNAVHARVNHSGTDMTTIDPCLVGLTDVTVAGDCKVKMSDGTECVTECGRLPGDGAPGTTLPVGCRVNISTSMIEFGTCVASCSDCK